MYCVPKIEYGSLATIFVITEGCKKNENRIMALKEKLQGTKMVKGEGVASFLTLVAQVKDECYHIYSSRATIFYFSDLVHFSAISPTYEMLR